MAILGIITDLGMQTSIDASSNEGFNLVPVSFGVSDVAGTLDPTRTTKNAGLFFSAAISSRVIIDQNTIKFLLTIPPNQIPAGTFKIIREIYLDINDSSSNPFLFAIGQPTDEIRYNSDDQVTLELEMAITNLDLTANFVFEFTQATEISDHNTDPAAHTEIITALKKAGIFLQAGAFPVVRRGQHFENEKGSGAEFDGTKATVTHGGVIFTSTFNGTELNGQQLVFDGTLTTDEVRANFNALNAPNTVEHDDVTGLVVLAASNQTLTTGSYIVQENDVVYKDIDGVYKQALADGTIKSKMAGIAYLADKCISSGMYHDIITGFPVGTSLFLSGTTAGKLVNFDTNVNAGLSLGSFIYFTGYSGDISANVTQDFDAVVTNSAGVGQYLTTQAAIDAVPSDGRILINKLEDVKTTINTLGKNLTIEVNGPDKGWRRFAGLSSSFRIDFDLAPTQGTFRLEWDSQETNDLAFNASNTDVQNEFNLLNGHNGFTVTGDFIVGFTFSSNDLDSYPLPTFVFAGVNETQRFDFSNIPDNGTITFEHKGSTTLNFPWDDLSSNLKIALEATPAISNVNVTGEFANQFFEVEFNGTYLEDGLQEQPLIQVVQNTLDLLGTDTDVNGTTIVPIDATVVQKGKKAASNLFNLTTPITITTVLLQTGEQTGADTAIIIDSTNLKIGGLGKFENFVNGIIFDTAATSLTIDAYFPNTVKPITKIGQVAGIDYDINAHGYAKDIFSQLRLLKHPTLNNLMIVTGAEQIMASGIKLSYELNSALIAFSGAQINFETGEILESDGITPLGTNFTPPVITPDQWRWFSVNLVADSTNADGSIKASILVNFAGSDGVSKDLAPKPLIADNPIGVIAIQGALGDKEQTQIVTVKDSFGSLVGKTLTLNNPTESVAFWFKDESLDTPVIESTTAVAGVALDTFGAIGNTAILAQKLVVAAPITIDRIHVFLSKIGSPTGSATVRLLGETLSEPDETNVIATGTLAVQMVDVGSNFSNPVIIDLGGDQVLAAGNYYVEVDSSSVVFSAGNFLQWNSEVSGAAEIFNFDGVNWLTSLGNKRANVDLIRTNKGFPAIALAASREVEILDLLDNDLQSVVASKLQAAINSDAAFNATVTTNKVIVENAALGDVADADMGDTGFFETILVQGTDTDPSGLEGVHNENITYTPPIGSNDGADGIDGIDGVNGTNGLDGADGAGFDAGDIGVITSGGETDEAIYWKRRFHPLQHMLNADSKNPTGFDPEGKSLKNELLQFIQSNDAGVGVSVDVNAYLGQVLLINKGSKISFKIKKGINFFSIISTNSSTRSNNVEVFIDGSTPAAINLIDENGGIALDSFSTVVAGAFNGNTRYYFGLDGEEHTITLVNNDSGSNNFQLEAVEVGYRSENPTIDETVHINAGKALVRGTDASFPDGLHTFGKTELNGHTGALVVDTAGVITPLDGESPAMTQCKPETLVAFSAPVTQLKVKNNFYFPANGICLLSTPYGNHHLFSYTGKTDAAIQSHSLDSLIWQSQPTTDFIPLDGFDSATVGAATGDLNINYWGTAPILIDATNNRIDFRITIGGVTTTHAATIANGRYAADLVPLENAVRTAMQAVKTITGEYHLKYNTDSQLWTIYVSGNEVENFELIFSSGVNNANSFHTTLGFPDTDFTGQLSYIGTTEVQHLCCRVLEADKVFMHSEDPRIKYASVNAVDAITQRQDIEQRLGLTVRKLALTNNMLQIFPDDDCSGLSVTFMRHQEGAIMTYQVDDGQCLYLHTTDTTLAATSARGQLITSFFSFPRGSRKITIRNETEANFKIASAANNIYFVGCRQYFTKPAYEKMATDQAIIKTFDISPISLYATMYGHNGGVLHSPNANDNNVNSVVETGSWVSTTWQQFNVNERETLTLNDFVDFSITLSGSGGGFFLRTLQRSVDGSRKVGLFVSQSAINEATDRVQNWNCRWGTENYDQDAIYSLGWTAGTYNIRLKNESATNRFVHQAFGVVDTVPPQENANDVTDINNIGQSIAYPVNVVREKPFLDSARLTPQWLERSGYKEGKVSNVNYSFNSPLFQYLDETTNLIVFSNTYYSILTKENVVGAEVSFSGFMKSISLRYQHEASYNNNMQTFIDGVQTANTHSLREQVKGGTAPSTTRESVSNAVQKLFNLSCTHNTGLVFNITDTRGIKNNTTVVLNDGNNKEKAVIDSFVVGVSFTIKKALTTVIAANVTSIEYQGFHTYKTVQGSAIITPWDVFEYEPLKISPSKAIQRSAIEFEYEKVSITFDNVANGDDLYYPVHSDGVVGNWTTSTISILGKGNTSGYDFPQDLKNIVVNSGILLVKISSERLVPVLKEQDRF